MTEGDKHLVEVSHFIADNYLTSAKHFVEGFLNGWYLRIGQSEFGDLSVRAEGVSDHNGETGIIGFDVTMIDQAPHPNFLYTKQEDSKWLANMLDKALKEKLWK